MDSVGPQQGDVQKASLLTAEQHITLASSDNVLRLMTMASGLFCA